MCYSTASPGSGIGPRSCPMAILQQGAGQKVQGGTEAKGRAGVDSPRLAPSGTTSKQIKPLRGQCPAVRKPPSFPVLAMIHPQHGRKGQSSPVVFLPGQHPVRRAGGWGGEQGCNLRPCPSTSLERPALWAACAWTPLCSRGEKRQAAAGTRLTGQGLPPFPLVFSNPEKAGPAVAPPDLWALPNLPPLRWLSGAKYPCQDIP